MAFPICIACSLSELLRCSIAQRTVRTFAVILLPPVRQGAPDIVQGPEPVGVQALVAQPSVEALHMPVLHRLRPAGCAPARSSAPRPSPASAANRTRAHCRTADSLDGRDPRSADPALRVTRPLPRLTSASSTRHSRVKASTTLRMRTVRPFASPSTMKSIAHSWFILTSLDTANGSRTRRLRFLRLTASPSSAYSR